jgi:hypothetical protein
MTVFSLDPLTDPRWDQLVRRHPAASIFHTTGWLRCLQRTYRYVPLAFTTSLPTAELRNALVCCAVRSWLTGSRLVSLPFSDHCDPLVGDAAELQTLCRAADDYRAARGWRYTELRPSSDTAAIGEPFRAADSYYLHRVDLRPSTEQLRRSFHVDSIQRRIRRAERESLVYETGRTDALVRKLYHLLSLTRRRHLVPLQPFAWFRNLVDALGDAVCIRVVSRDGEPAAGILSLTHGATVVYKYGGSDDRYHRFGSIPLLFWRLIEESKQAGAQELDLGRTDRDNTGLILFKDRWAARRSTLTYWRAPGRRASRASSAKLRLARRVFDRLPTSVRRATARFVYRHLG